MSQNGDTLRQMALRVAVEEMEVGAREEGGNNHGPWVAKYLAAVGLSEGYSWCQAFVTWCYSEACHRLGMEPMPFPRDGGSMRTCDYLEQQGYLTDHPLPGDLVYWRRGGPNLGALGHVGFVRFGGYATNGNYIQTVEGNHTSAVQEFHYEWTQQTRFRGFARIPDKYAGRTA